MLKISYIRSSFQQAIIVAKNITRKPMKAILTLLLFAVSLVSFSQTNSVGIGTLTPDGSAILHLESNDQGFLMTRMDSASIAAIVGPVEGLMVYNTADQCYWFNDGAAWTRICNTNDIYDSIASLAGDISNIYNTLVAHGDSISWIYDSLASHLTLINNNITNINNINTTITNHADSLSWIYDSLSSHLTNINNLTTIVNNHSDSLSWIYDSLGIHNTNISNLFDSINVHGGELDNKWDLLGNSGTNPATNYLGTSDAQDLVFRANATETARFTSGGKWGVGITAPTAEAQFNVNSFAITNGGAASAADWINGASTRFYWEPGSENLLIGRATGTEWDFGNVGTSNFYFGAGVASNASAVSNFGFGSNLSMNGTASILFGTASSTTGDRNMVYGINNTVDGSDNIVSGSANVLTDANVSQVFGANNTISDAGTATGNFIAGNNIDIIGDNNVGFGANVTLTSTGYSFAMGSNVVNTAAGSLVFGPSATNSAVNSLVVGAGSTNTGTNSVVIGVNSDNTGTSATVIGSSQSNGVNFKYLSGHGAGYELFSNFTETTGVILASGSGTWTSVSDRNLKTNVTELDYTSLLNKIRLLDISRWSYIAQTVDGQETDGLSPESIYTEDIFHIGPMAQDFHSAFGLSIDNKHITALDVSGVALAGVKAVTEENQALLEKVASLELMMLELQKQINELKK